MVVKANPPLSDLVELLGVSNDNLDAHFQLGLLEAEVQAGDFGIDDTFCHFYVENKQRVENLFPVTKPLCESVVINNPIQLFGQRRNETVDKRLSLRSLKARVLSPTRITAYIITSDIAAKWNGSSISWS